MTRLIALAVGCGLAAILVSPAFAQAFTREQDIGALRLGQRVLVDDGSCPAGQIKEVAGTRLTAEGVMRSRQCVPRAVRR